MSSRFGSAGLTAADLPQWRTYFDIDFVAEPSQLLNADGAYAIAGFPAVVENTANAHVGATMQIVNGTGLYLPCHTAGNVYNTNRLAPLLRFPVGGLTNTTPVRAQFLVGARTNGQGDTFLSFEYPSTANRNCKCVGFYLTAPNSTIDNHSVYYVRQNTNQTVVSAVGATLTADPDIGGILARDGVGPTSNFVVEVGRDADGDWARPTALAQVTETNQPVGTVVNIFGTTRAIQDPANWGIALSMHSTAVGAFHQIIERLRVLIYH